MNSTLNEIKDHYNTLIVGGGIVGAGLLRDLALHGINCLLIDKKDFSSQTSQSSSKMLHGGIRYLENFDFALVMEALHEKNLWLNLAPHLCYEKSFYFPVYKDSPKPLWMVRIGLMLYDYLSSFLNTPHKILTPQEVNKHFPTLNKNGLTGVGVYHDVVVDDVKLTLEVIYDALFEKNSQAVNYTSLVDIEPGHPCKVTLENELELGLKKTITADNVVFATGPFTDKLLGSFPELHWKPQLLPSKGSHIWLKRESLDIDAPMVLTTPDQRIIFTIPRRSGILVGTTEVQTSESFFDIKCSEQEVTYLLDTLNQYFPNENISHDDILSTFSGIRPLVKEEGSKDMNKTARVHKEFRPYSNISVLIGGKYTTFRTMVQDTARTIVLKAGDVYNKNKTQAFLRQESEIYPFQKSLHIEKRMTPEIMESILKNEYPKTFEDLIRRRIGIPSKKHWGDPKRFDQFFLNYLDLIQKYIKVTKEDILNYPS
ncbi:MAG: FAD-dependent oxidoreductase [Bacteriovoracaceae bacterium]